MLVALAALGVPLWLLLGWFAGGLWHRHDVTNNLPNVFKMKVRVVEGTYRHLDGNFSRTAEIAIWAHDILIIEKGLLLARNLHFTVADGLQPPQPADPDQVKKRLGDQPVTMQFKLDDGTIIEIAAAGETVKLAQGPFFSDSNESVSIDDMKK
jgi:hypothetical protein